MSESLKEMLEGRASSRYLCRVQLCTALLFQSWIHSLEGCLNFLGSFKQYHLFYSFTSINIFIIVLFLLYLYPVIAFCLSSSQTTDGLCGQHGCPRQQLYCPLLSTNARPNLQLSLGLPINIHKNVIMLYKFTAILYFKTINCKMYTPNQNIQKRLTFEMETYSNSQLLVQKISYNLAQQRSQLLPTCGPTTGWLNQKFQVQPFQLQQSPINQILRHSLRSPIYTCHIVVNVMHMFRNDRIIQVTSSYQKDNLSKLVSETIYLQLQPNSLSNNALLDRKYHDI